MMPGRNTESQNTMQKRYLLICALALNFAAMAEDPRDARARRQEAFDRAGAEAERNDILKREVARKALRDEQNTESAYAKQTTVKQQETNAKIAQAERALEIAKNARFRPSGGSVEDRQRIEAIRAATNDLESANGRLAANWREIEERQRAENNIAAMQAMAKARAEQRERNNEVLAEMQRNQRLNNIEQRQRQMEMDAQTYRDQEQRRRNYEDLQHSLRR